MTAWIVVPFQGVSSHCTDGSPILFVVAQSAGATPARARPIPAAPDLV
jgi:hypothetical protein